MCHVYHVPINLIFEIKLIHTFAHCISLDECGISCFARIRDVLLSSPLSCGKDLEEKDANLKPGIVFSYTLPGPGSIRTFIQPP